jgi:hypothetical protein
MFSFSKHSQQQCNEAKQPLRGIALGLDWEIKKT